MASDIPGVAKARRRPRLNDQALADFAARLGEAMGAAGYDPGARDQTRLQDAAGVDQSIISRALGLISFPSHAIVRKLALELQVSPAWLLWGDPPKGLTAAREPGSGATVEDLLELALSGIREQKR